MLSTVEDQDFVVHLLEIVNLCAIHAKCVTISEWRRGSGGVVCLSGGPLTSCTYAAVPKDMQLARRSSCRRCLQLVKY